MHDMADDTGSRFYNRLDFNNVGLMGHSRGGDAVVRAAIINANSAARALAKISRQYGIQTVCSLSPTDFTNPTTGFLCKAPMAIGSSGDVLSVSSLNRAHCRFYAVVYGALDGDVKTFGTKSLYAGTGTGFGHYDRAQTDKAMVFLDACNHNRFNDVWTADDNGAFSPDLTRLISRQGHRDLATEYICGLFRWQLLEASGPEFLFDGTAANATAAHAAIQWSFGLQESGLNVMPLDDMESTIANASARGPSGVIVSPMMLIVTSSGAQVGTYSCHLTGVLHVLQTAPSSNEVQAYTLTFASAQDWRDYDQFIFRVCADADVSTEMTAANSPLPNFTLVFTDAASPPNSAPITATSLRTADRPRTPVFHGIPPTSNWTVIRMETFAVKLASLSDIDLSQVKEIAMLIPGNFPRDQFFDSLELVNR